MRFVVFTFILLVQCLPSSARAQISCQSAIGLQQRFKGKLGPRELEIIEVLREAEAFGREFRLELLNGPVLAGFVRTFEDVNGVNAVLLDGEDRQIELAKIKVTNTEAGAELRVTAAGRLFHADDVVPDSCKVAGEEIQKPADPLVIQTLAKLEEAWLRQIKIKFKISVSDELRVGRISSVTKPPDFKSHPDPSAKLYVIELDDGKYISLSSDAAGRRTSLAFMRWNFKFVPLMDVELLASSPE